MTKRQTRLLVIAIILFLVLASLSAYFAYYNSTKKLAFNLSGNAPNVVQPPQFLFAFSGTGGGRLVAPIGIVVDGARVFVADAARSRIQVFDTQGKWQRSFGASDTIRPLYMAKNPKDGALYVTDRKKRAVLKFAPQGKYLGEFNPRLPKDQLPKFDTKGTQWTPVAIAFGPDGSLFVTETLNGHRLLIFGPDGKFKRSVGTAGVVSKADAAPGVFQFPNGLMVYANEVYVADSNNGRVQVFSTNGEFKRIIDTQGLPRGITMLSRFQTDTKGAPARLAVVDTLSHDATIFTTKGDKVLSFGAQGALPGQFAYPTTVSRGAKNRMYITDTSNGRVQVWGWPDQIAAVAVVGEPRNWAWCLVPLLLLPLLFLLRRRRFFAAADFVERMFQMEQTDLMNGRRRKWITTQDQFDKIRELIGGDHEVFGILHVEEHSESDANAIQSKYEVQPEDAVILAVAQRCRWLCTESHELQRVATRMEIDVADALEFIKRFAKRAGTDETGDA